MQTNVLEYLENTVDRVPDKTAFADEEMCIIFYTGVRTGQKYWN